MRRKTKSYFSFIQKYAVCANDSDINYAVTADTKKLNSLIRPSKKRNMFSVRVSQKKEGRGAFYFIISRWPPFFLKCQISIVFSTAQTHNT